MEKKDRDGFFDIVIKHETAYSAPKYSESETPTVIDIYGDDDTSEPVHSAPVPDRMKTDGPFDRIHEFSLSDEKPTEEADGEKAEEKPDKPDTAEHFGMIADDTAHDNDRTAQALIPNGKTEASASQYRTSSYKGQAANYSKRGTKPTANAPKIINEYSPDGPLIHKITVMNWTAEKISPYRGEHAEALRYHRMSPQFSLGEIPTPIDPEPYFHYIPRYNYLSDKTKEYYLEIREAIRESEFDRLTAHFDTVNLPETGRYNRSSGLPFVLLYIFEIINLSENVISPAEGLELISSLWIGLRGYFPTLDGYLCDWLPDYCMIHALRIPHRILPILPNVAFKASFKDFYLNLNPEDNEECLILARMLTEILSDYNYRESRCYPENSRLFDTHITGAVSALIRSHYTEKRGIFCENRILRTTRDTYNGAVLPHEIKKRIDIEFTSITRRFEYRAMFTSIIKYAENKIRAMTKVKAKLGAKDIAPEDAAVIDAYFAPLLTEDKPKKGRKNDGDGEEYLKHYEAETRGFDLSAAEKIERASWANTERLVADSETEEAYAPVAPVEPAKPVVQTPPIPSHENEPELTEAGADAPHTDGATPIDIDAVRAALEGQFGSFARKAGIFPGRLADEINTLFLDIVGDILLEDNGNGYELIEDYREDAISWLKTK